MADFSRIPVIPLAAPGATRAIAAACETAGFFYIVDHGVAPAAIDGIFAAARWFFALPQSERDALDVATSPHYRGYVPMATKGAGVPVRRLEAFQTMLDLGPDDPDVRRGSRMHGPNRWPANAAPFRAAMEGFYADLTALAHRLLGHFAAALDLDPGYFRPIFAKPLTQLRLLHYPPQPPDAGAQGVEAHTDPGFFTILLQDEVGGLEACNRAGEWIAAPPVAHAFVVNVGDMMQHWTGGRFVSTPHRVANRTGRDRISVPFFVNPDYGATIAPLRAGTGGARGEALACGPYIEAAYRAAWPNRADRAAAAGVSASRRSGRETGR